MVGQVSETVHTMQWDFMAVSTMATDRILKLLMILKYNCSCMKTQTIKAHVMRVTCNNM
jgi:hypothetical protein